MAQPLCVPLVTLSPYTQATLSLGHTRPPTSLDVPYLRAQLDRIEATLAVLLDQRSVLTARLTEAVALTSPVRLLSTELLSAIFAAAVEPESGTQDAPCLVSTLMLVCRHWRDVCIGTPELWCRINISPNEPESLERARRRLARSKAVPLDIFLDFSSRSSYSGQVSKTAQAWVSPDQLLKTSILLLRPTIARWRTFLLYVPYRPQANAAMSLCSSAAPLLESLSIQVSNPMLHSTGMEWDSDRTARTTIPFQGITPRLRACSLTSFWCERPEEFAALQQMAAAVPVTEGRHHDAPPVVVGHGWSRMVFPGVGPGLTRLRLIGYWNEFAPNMNEMLIVLRQCPHLEDLYIRNLSDLEPAEVDLNTPVRSPIVMTHLKRISFYYSGITRTCAILHSIVLPALEHLELAFLDNITTCLKHLKRQTVMQAGFDYAYEYEYGYRGTVEAAHFPLKSLRIEASLFSELNFLRLLRRLPQLEKLELVDIEDVSGSLLKGMSGPAYANEWILPSLRTLNLEGCTSFEWEDLKKFVESRLPSSSASSSAAAYLQQKRGIRTGQGVSSASQYARFQMDDSPYMGVGSSKQMDHISKTPQKLQKLDLTRCSQISRERMHWLKMYVPDTVCKEESKP
ncbi:hypothetical protein M422DRAFT_240647 [Sphaerobolus stellatus SS14]|nr:hypothetical protein M422DRAFT_240647 [Sphaerobolus stellatus SS14]